MVMRALEYAEVREEDEGHVSPLDLLFESIERRKPDSVAVRQYNTDIQLKTFIHGMEVFNMKIIMRRDSVILSKSRNRFRQRRNLSD